MNFNKNFTKLKLSTAGLILLEINQVFATNNVQKDNTNLMNNTLFWILLALILVLLFFISSVSKVIKNITETDLKKSDSSSSTKTFLLLAIILGNMIDPNFVNATDLVSTTTSAGEGFFRAEYGGLSAGLFYIMITAIILEVFILSMLLMLLRKMLNNMGMISELETEEKPLFDFSKISAGLTDAIPIDRESEIMTDHEYDGIRELDNNLPPWWKYGFYLTIIISIVYLFNYHILRSYPLQSAEYMKEIENAAIEKEAYLKTVADKVDESNVLILQTPSEIKAGENLFQNNCVACHGKYGEGTVGPNLTDAYWLHGGGVKNIFKTIKYGVPAKGMIAWQAQFKPSEIQQLASYIISLNGSNPAGAKAAQGDFYDELSDEEKNTNADSTSADSTLNNKPKLTDH